VRVAFWRKQEAERGEDELVARALEEGRVPEETPPELRELLSELLRAEEVLRAAAPSLRAEAATARERSRGRFYEAMASRAEAGRRERLARVRLVGALATLAAAIGLLLVAAVLLRPGEQTASAEPLRPGEVVELEGVLVRSETGLAVASPFGTFPLEVPPEAAVTDLTGRPVAAPTEGTRAVVVARVDADRRLVASALAIGEEEPAPQPIPVERLARLEHPLRATVVSAAMEPNGERVRLIVRTANEQRLLLVEAPLALVRPLLHRGDGLAGLEVEVRPVRGEGATGVTLVPAGERRARAAVVTVQGRVDRVLGDGFVLSTPRGPLSVRLAPEALLVSGDRAVPLREVDLDALVGETVAATGVAEVTDAPRLIATRVVLAGD